jgi:20S proteasome alpha/beta subunit
MTLIIGIRCKNGVVIATDQKAIRGGEAEYTNKIFEINNVALAIEGLTGLADDFLYLLDLELRRRRGVDTLYEMKVIAEDIVSDLTQTYEDRVKEKSPIGILMAGREQLTQGKAKLYYIHGVGYGESVEFLCSGHGGPYATTLAKFLLNKELDCDENAKRAAFVISWIAEDVDITVGGDPNVAIILDSETPSERPIKYLSRDIVNQMKEYANKIKKVELPKLFFGETKGK